MKWLRGIGVVWFLGIMARSVMQGAPWWAYAFPVVVIVALVLPLARPYQIVVNAHGIRLSMRRKITWPQVDAVQEPGTYSQVVVLRMATGRDRKIGLPPRYAQQVAAVGDVPLT